jgi:hypothetical protein
MYPTARLSGFDISSEARLEGRLDSRIHLRFAPSLRAAGFQSGQFDLIVMRHVLEHVPDLWSFLVDIRDLGSDSCVLYVRVPNRASLAARVFGRYWYGLDFPRHLYYFTPRHLGHILRGSGFEGVAWRHEIDAIDWAGSLRFLITGVLGAPIGRSGLASALLLAARIGFLPVGMASHLLRRSSRIWTLARKGVS